MDGLRDFIAYDFKHFSQKSFCKVKKKFKEISKDRFFEKTQSNIVRYKIDTGGGNGRNPCVMAGIEWHLPSKN